MDDQHQIFLSGDGSHSIISSNFETSYHSKHGAVTESTVIFIKAGLDFLAAQGYTNINIFEMGFGTGLNALLSYSWAEKHHIQINYHSVEEFPLATEVTSQLNYGNIFQLHEVFNKLHEAPWREMQKLSRYFSFIKYDKKLEDFEEPDKFDVIFYDAFAPANQPELWNVPMMLKMYNLLDISGVLVSFCAQGAFKRNLKTAGFSVESIPGPPGKREMTRAIKF